MGQIFHVDASPALLDAFIVFQLDERDVEVVPHVFRDEVSIESVKGIPHLTFIIFGEGRYS